MSDGRRQHGSWRGGAFTLVELLVVVAIIALLISVLMPSLRQAREAGRAIACGSNERQIAIAFNMYKAEFGGAWPYGVPRPIEQCTYPDPKYGGTPWNLDGSFGGGVPPQQQFYTLGYIKDIRLWYCPTDPTPLTHNWWWYTNHPNITGSSYMFSEQVLFGYSNWYKKLLTDAAIVQPASLAFAADGFMCPNGWNWGNVDPEDPILPSLPALPRIDWTHDGTVNFAFADGHVERLYQRDARYNIRSNPLHMQPTRTGK